MAIGLAYSPQHDDLLPKRKDFSRQLHSRSEQVSQGAEESILRDLTSSKHHPILSARQRVPIYDRDTNGIFGKDTQA